MSLRNDAEWKETHQSKYLDNDDDRGTSITWATTVKLLVVMLPYQSLIFVFLLKYTFIASFYILLGALVFHGLVWNALHPSMHGLPDIPITTGAPSIVLKWLNNSSLFQYLYKYHELHHTEGGFLITYIMRR